MRLKGRNQTESEHVKLGAYHTLELEAGRAFVLYKQAWDALDAERLRTACDPAASADLAAVLISGEGLAHVCLVGGATTLVRAKIEATLPRKRGAAAAGYDKAWTKFLDQVFAAVVRHVDWSIVKCLVIAGPGFAKDEFKAHLELEAVRQGVRPLIEHKSSVVVAPASTAYKHSLKEVLAQPAVAARIKDTKAARESAALQAFYAMLAADPARAFYGPGHVAAAAELGAIQTLLISGRFCFCWFLYGVCCVPLPPKQKPTKKLKTPTKRRALPRQRRRQARALRVARRGRARRRRRGARV